MMFNKIKKEIMPKITILPHSTLCPQGIIIFGSIKEVLCNTLLKNHINIEHACEKSCACTTCHVIIRKGFDTLIGPTDKEEDLLDMAWGLEATSRLSCQVILGIEDLTIEIPKYTVNQVSENS